jgi:hypothetical protein
VTDEAPNVSTFYHVYGATKYHKMRSCASYFYPEVVRKVPLTQAAADELRKEGHLCLRCCL